MRIVLAAAIIAITTANAGAKTCYQNVDDPTWSVVINDSGSNPEWVWTQGDTEVDVFTTGAGTGVSVLVAWPENDDEGTPFIFHKGDLILGWNVYEPIPCN